jgi:hypothetical protein
MVPALITCSKKIEEDLIRLFGSKPRLLRKYLWSLLQTVLTTEAQPDLAQLSDSRQVRGLHMHLKQLLVCLRKNPNVPRGICAHYEYNMSSNQARKRYRVTGAEWAYVHDLANRLGFEFEAHIPYAEHVWHDKLEEEVVNIEVLLDPRALNDMLVAAYEGYMSPRRIRQWGYEVFGINLGMIREEFIRKKGSGMSTLQYVYIIRSQPQLSAVGAYREVDPSPKSLKAVISVSRTLFPQYEVVGDFHSHIYRDFKELEYCRGWDFSDADQKMSPEWARQIREMGGTNRFVAAFVVAMARSAYKVNLSRYKKQLNTLQTTVGDCRVVVAVYRILRSGLYSRKKIRIRVPGMVE